MRQFKRLLALTTAFAIMLTVLTVYAKNDKLNNTEDYEVAAVSSESSLGYDSYISDSDNIPYGNEIILGTDTISSKGSDVEVSDDLLQSGVNGAILPDDSFISWNFSTDEKCTYAISVEYMAAEQSGGNLEFELLIDGATPFSEAKIISLPRTFIQESSSSENTSGNDIKPNVYEKQLWKTQYMSDSSGYVQTPFKFVFEKGNHTITFKGSRGKIAIHKVLLSAYSEPTSYSEYIARFDGDKKKLSVEPIVLEGEKFQEKNSVTVLPTTDRSSSATYPQSASSLKLNAVGGSTWKNIGEALTWEFEIEEDGLYEISSRFMQETKDGIFTCRKLLIDGQLPFSEASSLRFDYGSGWQCEKFSSADGKAFSFYLTKGKHTLTLEVVAGDVAEIVATVSDSLTELNKIYRQIVLITGTSPDKNRDYNFKNLIPDELQKMKEIHDSLQKSVDNINEQAGTNGSFVSIIQKIIFQLEKMTDNPRTIASYFSRFKSNLGSLGEWLLTATAQPLEIDRIYIMPSGSDLPKANAGFFKDFWFSLSCFASSYVTDYTSIGQNDKKDDGITVWIQTGRDQGEVLRDLIDSSFSKEHNASVKLQIVATGLLQSVLSGNSPDVVLDCTDALPMDYALRNAVVNLAEFKDYNEISKRFSEASLKPVSFNGAVYGMPQTFDFYMMFYRTDVFSEYGYKVPETWTELRDLIPSMQRNRLQFGLPHDVNMYAAFLYQNGGELYKDNGAATNLDSGSAVATFTDFTEFFTLYDCPVTYDFSNRFRSGEMPIAVAPLTQYNQLTAFAPEIKGLWEMVPIPGTESADGSVNNTSTGAATYIIMLKNCKNKELAWDFMKWFTSTDVQGKYAVQMESILGNCAKVATANVEALKNMTWSSSEYKPLIAQMNNTDAVPQVPGGYYLSRIVGFAFNRVYNNDENPSETLTDYVKELNEEISRKREEFGLAGDTVAK